MILYVFDSLKIYINTDFYNHCKVISPGQQFLLDQLYVKMTLLNLLESIWVGLNLNLLIHSNIPERM